MCECSGKLIAWLDRELPAEEAAELERHVEDCAECRVQVDAYKRLTTEIDFYCDETLASSARPAANPWTAVAASAGAAAALIALLFVWPSASVQPLPSFPAPVAQEAVVVSPAPAESAPPAPIRPVRKVARPEIASPEQVRETEPGSARNRIAYDPPQEPVIQISIPAEEVFPPGAVPPGMHFVADVTIAPDGSAERMSLHPRLAGFERRTVQP